jgi:transposase
MENAIRPSAIGKMNSLFIGHLRTGKRAAILYLPLVYCQRHSKDPLRTCTKHSGASGP